ncbi:hypothetical protein DEU56DRAFT_931054 [Suillus clintonianus]|uniref:uncharacterized protein n=1 Tax=Suillus clintonianus TaxID=1904413 RepID=UPI001B86DE45|nr:uncharacterized protein DEU56DRAFT_931054 [Suillus clintonianus]KAG2146795.1 hypothetical protein DEU56DRAFT_931054 [Suillus clintonianus]
MPNSKLPVNSWLGYTFDLSTTTTMDITTATHAVLKIRRIIDYKPDTVLGTFETDGQVYDVPTAVSITTDVLSPQGGFRHYSTGTDATTDFRKDTSLSMRYLAVQSSPSCSARSLTKENQYAFYSFTKIMYGAYLKNYGDLLDERALLEGVADLPIPFSGTDPDILKQYKVFFQGYGSHVIIGGNYGARFQMNVWASNKTDAVNEKFGGDVVAAFDGIPYGGKYDHSLPNEPQYKTFLEYMQKLVSVSGGDPKYALAVAANPSCYATYESWLKSVTNTPRSTVLNLQTEEIWVLMRRSTDMLLKYFADQLEAAFTYILAHPKHHKTAVVFEIESNWAEFNLLTPNATVGPDPKHLYPFGTIASNTRVKWSHNYAARRTLRFFIINDGSPIDFSISHGSGGHKGMAQATIENRHYLNDDITGNTHWFYRAPVSGIPEKDF